MREGRGLAFVDGFGTNRLNRGNYQEMSAIGRARAVQPRVTEAKNLIIAVVITGRVECPFVDQHGNRLRAETDHSERHHRAGKVIAADPRNASGADKRMTRRPNSVGWTLVCSWPGFAPTMR